MSKKIKGGRKKVGVIGPKTRTLEKTFDQITSARAREIAEQYRVVLEPNEDSWLGWSLEMPGVLAEGETKEKCLSEIYKALTFTLSVLLREGETPPTPLKERERRSIQVNVRLSPGEKLILEQAARRQGFKGLADFLRFAGLQEGRLGVGQKIS